jgi:hypothetical protein
VLSAFTWSGHAGDGNWDNGANWVGGTAPTSGTAEVTFPTIVSPQTIMLQADEPSLVLDSITVQGGSYTLEGPTTNAVQQLFLADGAALNLQNGSTLAIADNGSPGHTQVSLNGAATVSGNGTLRLNIGLFGYKSGSALQPFHLTNNATVVLGGSQMSKSLVNLDGGTKLVVPDTNSATIGSLTGSGTVQIGSSQYTDSNGLNLVVPAGENDVFSGVIDGPGGFIHMAAAVGDHGNLTLKDVNPDSTGPFDLTVGNGSLLVNGKLNLRTLLVLQGATFGAAATVNVSETVLFQSGSTFAAFINGTAPGKFTQLIDTDTTDPNPVNLGGSTLAVFLGYTPAKGDTNKIISAGQAITGQFANAHDGQTLTVNGVQYTVHAPGTSITLAAPPVTIRHLVATTPGPVTAGVPFSVTVKVEDASNTVDTTFNSIVTISLAQNPGGSTLTGSLMVAAKNGVATFSNLVLNKAGSGYTLTASATGLASATAGPFNVTKPTPPSPVEITRATVVFGQNKDKNGKPVGNKFLVGFQFTFNTTMNRATAGNPRDYSVAMFKMVKQGVGKKAKTVRVPQPVGFTVTLSGNTVLLRIAGKQTFSQGGQITLSGNISSLAGGLLDGNRKGVGGTKAVYNISPNARSISHA